MSIGSGSRATLELTAARLVAGLQPSEDLPDLAAELLVAGVDSPALRISAGISRSEVRDARDSFVEALGELEIPLPDIQSALAVLARQEVWEISRGVCTPYDGAAWIWRNLFWRLANPGALAGFVGLASEWEDHPAHRAQYDEQIVALARTIVSSGYENRR